MTFKNFAVCCALVLYLLFEGSAFAQDGAPPPPSPPATPEPPSQAMPPAIGNEGERAFRPFRFERRWGRGNRGNAVVSVGRDATLAADQRADSVVAILGSSDSAGEVSNGVVAVLGNTHVTGPVGDSVVAVLGNTYVNNRVGDQVVAVLGNVELGPEAVVDGDVVAVGGSVNRDPAAVIRGAIRGVSFPGNFGGFDWIRPWIHEALLYARPLALAPGLGWAWTLALSFLALYVLLALLFSKSVDHCVHTLETQPGYSLLTALLALLLTPVLFLLLVITVIGIAVTPFLGIALFCAGLFGKTVMLAWIGRRCTQSFAHGPSMHTALAVLIGGVIVLALYLVPVLGFIVFKLLGLIGFGVVLYTLIDAAKVAKEKARAAAPNADTGTAHAAATAPPTRESEPSSANASSESAAAQPAGSASQTASAAPASLPRAGFWIRMGALLIDLLLVTFILGFLRMGAGHKIELLALAAYGAVMWKLKGATIGGVVCKLQIVRLDGRPIDWPTAVVRALSCFLSLAIAGLGFFWIAFDDERQAWHDKIAGTVVVRIPKGVSLL